MTVRTAAAIGSVVFALASGGCLKVYDTHVEIPIQAKIDVSSFRRVLVAGFLAGGSKSIDANTETARLLKTQLRSKQDMRVVDGDVISLADEVDKRNGTSTPSPAGEPKIKDERDLARYEPILSDESYWKQIAQEHDGPLLIVTGSVLFTEITKSGMVSRPTSSMNPDGTEQFRTERVYQDMKGYALSPTFVFIDGRTGKQLAKEPYHEETLYSTTQNTPALSSYFELMDKLLPNFLNTLSSQKIPGNRSLLK